MDDKYAIIVVDDDEILSRLLMQYFTEAGHVCEAFPSAEAALDRISGTAFDILVADIVLPGMKGLELADRAHRLRPEMSIVVTTGFIDDFSYDEAIAAGAADFIKKPFSLNELMIRIKHVRLQERLHKMSITDELTGLPNRRGFFVLAEQQLRVGAAERVEPGPSVRRPRRFQNDQRHAGPPGRRRSLCVPWPTSSVRAIATPISLPAWAAMSSPSCW